MYVSQYLKNATFVPFCDAAPHITYSKNKICTVMNEFLKHVFIGAGKHTTIHVVHPHNQNICNVYIDAYFM